MGKGDEEMQNLLIEFTELLRCLSIFIDLVQFKKKVYSAIFILGVNLCILYVNWVEIAALLAATAWCYWNRNTYQQSPSNAVKSDKDIGHSVIYLEKINIGLHEFKLQHYSYKHWSVAAAVAAVLRVALPRRFFYALAFTSVILVNSNEFFVIVDSLQSDYSLKDKRVGFIAYVKDRLKTLKRNKSKNKSKETLFRFEIYENQRWWMGLDWTHALLPGERPTWSDASLNPVLPPTTFNLPQDTSTMDKVVYTWTWADESWLVATPGQPRPFKQLPLPNVGEEKDEKSDNSTHSFSVDRSGAEKALKQGLAKFNRHSVQMGESNQKSAGGDDKQLHRRTSIDSVAGTGHESGTVDGVDEHGWSYGDNQWERWSSKNGMGCYTRRRKWMRTAVLKQVLLE